MNKNTELNNFTWLNKPEHFTLANNKLTVKPDSETDLWQRTYYGFRNDNSPMFLTEKEGDFSFTVKTTFEYINRYDQCGIVIYENSDNWVKASVEYENKHISRLGSVVTNLGYSDWATTDIDAATNSMWYRISRRKQDFLTEYSSDGKNYKQMRIFHLHRPVKNVRVGVYACCPVKSGFVAEFSGFKFEKCLWQKHE